MNIKLKRRPTDSQLWDLTALFHRYGVDMRQHARFCTASNAEWFGNPDMYWCALDFEGSPPRP